MIVAPVIVAGAQVLIDQVLTLGELIAQVLTDFGAQAGYLEQHSPRMSSCVRSVLGRAGGVVSQMGRYWFQSRMFMRADGAICRDRV